MWLADAGRCSTARRVSSAGRKVGGGASPAGPGWPIEGGQAVGVVVPQPVGGVRPRREGGDVGEPSVADGQLVQPSGGAVAAGLVAVEGDDAVGFPGQAEDVADLGG